MGEYLSNSHKSKELAAENREEKRVKKVVSGKVKTRENKSRKLTDIFISEDASSVKSYIFMDVVVPAFKKLISDIARDGIDMLLYGKSGGSSRSSSSNKISYRSYYDDRHADRYSSNQPSRTRIDYEDIVFETRGEAEAVRKQMLEVKERYGLVTVADMYDMADLTAPYTATKYGWTDLRNAEVVRIKDGYIIKLPKAMPFD